MFRGRIDKALIFQCYTSSIRLWKNRPYPLGILWMTCGCFWSILPLSASGFHAHLLSPTYTQGYPPPMPSASEGP
jgi:hypothetical protein